MIKLNPSNELQERLQEIKHFMQELIMFQEKHEMYESVDMDYCIEFYFDKEANTMSIQPCYISLSTSHKTLPDNIIESEKVRKNLVSFINSFDDSIIDIEVEKISVIEESDSNNYRVFTVHKSDKETSIARISMNEESSGTKKMFSLYQTLLDVLEKGTVFFADELDIKLHPLLMRNILLTFTDKEKNPNNAQLIFTTHNTIYMDMNLLRRDEIWFVEKDNGVSNLYSLDDITNEKGEKVRKDSNYEKHYLLGNYGAIPNLKNLLGRE